MHNNQNIKFSIIIPTLNQCEKLKLCLLKLSELHFASDLFEVLVIDNGSIDESINRMLEHRSYFESWQTKLKESFSKDEYLFAKEVLNIISEDNIMESSQIINIAAKHSLDADEAKDMNLFFGMSSIVANP